MTHCELRKANSLPEADCETKRCTYWHIAEQAGLEVGSDWSGCAIQHFSLLDGGEGVAAWLWSVKERLEGIEAVADDRPRVTDGVVDPRD